MEDNGKGRMGKRERNRVLVLCLAEGNYTVVRIKASMLLAAFRLLAHKKKFYCTYIFSPIVFFVLRAQKCVMQSRTLPSLAQKHHCFGRLTKRKSERKKAWRKTNEAKRVGPARDRQSARQVFRAQSPSALCTLYRHSSRTSAR